MTTPSPPEKESPGGETDFFSTAYFSDPYPTYDYLRSRTPVHRTRAPQGFDIWLLTRYADAKQALNDGRLSRDLRHVAPEVLAVTGEPDDPSNRNLLTADPPDHTRLRRLVHKAFTTGRVKTLVPRTQALVDGLLDEMAEQDEFDLITAFSFPVPITVICELLGVPQSDREAFRRWTAGMVVTSGDDEAIELLRSSQESLRQYFVDLISHKRSHPGDDLITDLISAREDGQRLSEDELIGLSFMLMVAGHETTVNLITTAIKLLLTHPEQMARMRADPDLLPSAINETLRFDGPAGVAFMVAAEEVELSGVRIPRGEVVTPLLHAANRDPERFPNAHVFDIGREDNPHLGFGHGIHRCIGAPLATLEARVAIGSLVRRFPDLSLTVDPHELQWRSVPFFRGLTKLPLTPYGNR